MIKFFSFFVPLIIMGVLHTMETDSIKIISSTDSEKHSIIQHIKEALNNPEKDPFITTALFRYNKSEFMRDGDISILDMEDIAALEKNGNWVYTSFFGIEKTRLSGKGYDEVGALIIGTTDKNSFKKIRHPELCKAKIIIK